MPDLDPALTAMIDRLVPPLPGWCSPEKARRLARLVVETRPALCVELGVFGGRSLLALALGLRHVGAGRVDGIDPYTVAAALEGVNDKANDDWWSALSYEEIFKHASDGLARGGVLDHARIVRARSQDAVTGYAPASIDILHQDSNHSEAVSTTEVRAWAPLMKDGGYWIMDDTNWPTTRAANWLLRDTFGFKLVESYGPASAAPEWCVFKKGE